MDLFCFENITIYKKCDKNSFNVKSQQNQSHSSVSQLRFILHAKVLTSKTMHLCFLGYSSLLPVGVPEIVILYSYLLSPKCRHQNAWGLDGQISNPKDLVNWDVWDVWGKEITNSKVGLCGANRRSGILGVGRCGKG